MIIDVKTSVNSATPWNKIPDGVFRGKIANSASYADCMWFKFKNKLYMLQNLAYPVGEPKVSESDAPNEMFYVEPIQFNGVK